MIRLLFAIFFTFLFEVTATANEPNKVIELKKKIEEEKAAIETLTKTEKKITLTIVQINEKIKALKKHIWETERNMAKMQAELNNLYGEKKKIANEIDSKRSEIEKRLILWHKTYLLKPSISFISPDDIKSPILFESYMRYIFNYDRMLFDYLKETQERFVKNMEHIQKKKSEISLVEKDLLQKKKEQEELEKLYQQRLKETKKEKDIHAKNLKHAEAALRKLETVLKKVETVPEYAGKGLSKGILPYPVAGTIVGHYGKETGETKGALFVRKGVEIKANVGAAVRAVDNGKIVYTGWIKNLGNICILSHGKHYYTVYGRLSSLTKSKNEEVKQGEVIGFVGNDANFFDFPTLYFEIREGNTPLNPESWLR